MYQDSNEPKMTSRRVQVGQTGPYEPFGKLKSADAPVPPAVTVSIAGYRQLSADEQALINEIKAHGEATLSLVNKVMQLTLGDPNPNHLNSNRWASLAQTDLQMGFMKLIRAVARPTTF